MSQNQQIELSKSEVKAIKDAIRFLMNHISEYDHTLNGELTYDQAHKTKMASLAPFNDVMNKLPDLRAIK